MKITKKMKEEFLEKAIELALSYNPYIKEATPYMIDGKEMYIYAGESMTREQIDDAYINTAAKDIEQGYSERMSGYYDKWFRYERTDEGRAYDAGQRIAADREKCPREFHIIEIAECNR